MLKNAEDLEDTFYQKVFLKFQTALIVINFKTPTFHWWMLGKRSWILDKFSLKRVLIGLIQMNDSKRKCIKR